MNLPATTNGLEQGRPPIVKRDRERARYAMKAISLGHSTTMAAQAAGVSRRTIYAWLDKGKQIRELKEYFPEQLPLTPFDKDYLWFISGWEKAELKRKAELLKRISDAGGDGKWQADAWLLERLHPDEFSTRRELKVSSDNRNQDAAFTIQMGNAVIADPIEPKAIDFEIVDE